MACLVCEHSKRWEIEEALRTRKSKNGVAKEFGIARSTLQYHLDKKHEEKNPAERPEGSIPESVDDFPNDQTVMRMQSNRERQSHVDRILASGKYRGTDTIAKLARLWRPMLHNEAEDRVAEMFANAARKHRLLRGPKDVRRELAFVLLQDLHRRCVASGDHKTELAAIQAQIELDNLKENPSLDRAVLVQIVQLIKHEAPHLERRVEEHLAQFEIVVDQAKAVLEGEIPQEAHALSPKEESIPEAPPTPRSDGSGIDTGISSSEEPSSE